MRKECRINRFHNVISEGFTDTEVSFWYLAIPNFKDTNRDKRFNSFDEARHFAIMNDYFIVK
jgi:hypothetical protein